MVSLGKVDGRVSWGRQQQESGGWRPEAFGCGVRWAWGLEQRTQMATLSTFFPAGSWLTRPPQHPL